MTPIHKYSKGLLLVSLIVIFACKKSPDNQAPSSETHIHGIIPLPLNVSLSDGNLNIDKDIVLVNNPLFENAITAIEKSLNQILPSSVAWQDAPGTGMNIQFSMDSSLNAGAYQITINDKGIEVKAKNPAAGFYAAQSVCQMIWNASSGQKMSSFNLKQMVIKDEPKYAWRGFHLDVSRHMFTKEYILQLIDWMAYYKLNVLHLHLSDDQGWRIQVDQFPLLTEIGSWRTFNNYDSACINLAKTDPYYAIEQRFIREVNGKPEYGGFYTKQDIRDIITYATADYVDVVPEIDMPGHMSAAIRAYPFLSCADSAGWGTEFSYPICPCNQETMNFAYKVWDEIADLFPSKYVHIGCDEVETTTWAASAECQAFMTQNNIPTLKGIQNYFVKKLQEHLEAKGKTVIAWDDVIDGSVNSKLTMMYWRNWVTDSPDRCAANGNAIILTPASPFYLASENTDQSFLDLYNYDPATQYSASVLGKISGMQSCLWTEIVPSESIFEKVTFPRMQALSEICWSSGRDLNSFKTRMKSHFTYMNSLNIHYRRPGWQN